MAITDNLLGKIRNAVNTTAFRTTLALGTVYTADALLNTTEMTAQTITPITNITNVDGFVTELQSLQWRAGSKNAQAFASSGYLRDFGEKYPNAIAVMRANAGDDNALKSYVELLTVADMKGIAVAANNYSTGVTNIQVHGAGTGVSTGGTGGQNQESTATNPAYGALVLAYERQIEWTNINNGHLDGKGSNAPDDVKVSGGLKALGYTIVRDAAHHWKIESRSSGKALNTLANQELRKLNDDVKRYNAILSTAKTNADAATRDITEAQKAPYIASNPSLNTAAYKEAMTNVEARYKTDLNKDGRIGELSTDTEGKVTKETVRNTTKETDDLKIFFDKEFAESDDIDFSGADDNSRKHNNLEGRLSKFLSEHPAVDKALKDAFREKYPTKGATIDKLLNFSHELYMNEGEYIKFLESIGNDGQGSVIDKSNSLNNPNAGPDMGVASTEVGGGTYYPAPGETKAAYDKSQTLEALAALGVTDKPDERPLADRSGKQLQSLLEVELTKKMREDAGGGVGSLMANTGGPMQDLVNKALEDGVNRELISNGVKGAMGGTHASKVTRGGTIQIG